MDDRRSRLAVGPLLLGQEVESCGLRPGRGTPPAFVLSPTSRARHTLPCAWAYIRHRSTHKLTTTRSCIKLCHMNVQNQRVCVQQSLSQIVSVKNEVSVSTTASLTLGG